MENKLDEFLKYFKETNGTGLLVIDNDENPIVLEKRLKSEGFGKISNLLDIKDVVDSYFVFLDKENLKYIYNIYKQISDGLSMIQSKDPEDLSDEIINIKTKNFRFLLVASEGDLKYAQNILDYDFINLAGMIEYIK